MHVLLSLTAGPMYWLHPYSIYYCMLSITLTCILQVAIHLD